jgi:catechol 2,3-dioxygenase-like lactoylglutathione lyase family enzyme
MDNFETITLIAEDLSSAKSFYVTAFSGEVVYEDSVSWVFRLNEIMINLLTASEAGELVEPLIAGGRNNTPRALFTIRVSDVDARCRELTDQGISLLNGPVDRPWGRRTAAFSDPDGNVWELAQQI